MSIVFYEPGDVSAAAGAHATQDQVALFDIACDVADAGDLRASRAPYIV